MFLFAPRAFRYVAGAMLPFVVVWTPGLAGAQRGAMMPGATTGGDRFVSPAVIATTIAHVDSRGDIQLDLLALWRGTPGWFTRGPGGGGSGGQSSSLAGRGAAIVTSALHYGNTSLRLTLDVSARTVDVFGKRLALGNDNVLLVDNVDGPPGSQTIDTRRVDPSMPGGMDVLPLLRQLPEMLDFLRCDARLEDQFRREQMELVCAQIFRRCDARLANPELQRYLEMSCR